MLLISLNC